MEFVYGHGVYGASVYMAPVYFNPNSAISSGTSTNFPPLLPVEMVYEAIYDVIDERHDG